MIHNWKYYLATSIAPFDIWVEPPRRFAYGSHKLLKSNLTVDRDVVEVCFTAAIRALMKRAAEDWNNPFLPKFIKWVESEWGNGGLEVGAVKQSELHVRSRFRVEPVLHQVWCAPSCLRLKVIMRSGPNEDVKKGFKIVSIEMYRFGFVIVQKLEGHEW